MVKTCYNMRCHKSVAGAWSRRVNAQPADSALRCHAEGAVVLNPVVAKPVGLMDRFRAPLQGMPFIPALRAYSGVRPREAISQATRTLGRLGTLEVRLARTAAEVRRAQKLRYRVFYGEMGARADPATTA